MSPRCFYREMLVNGNGEVGVLATRCYSLDATAHLDGKVRRRIIVPLALLDLCRRLNALWSLLGEEGHQDLLPLVVRACVL